MLQRSCKKPGLEQDLEYQENLKNRDRAQFLVVKEMRRTEASKEEKQASEGALGKSVGSRGRGEVAFRPRQPYPRAYY